MYEKHAPHRNPHLLL